MKSLKVDGTLDTVAELSHNGLVVGGTVMDALKNLKTIKAISKKKVVLTNTTDGVDTELDHIPFVKQYRSAPDAAAVVKEDVIDLTQTLWWQHHKDMSKGAFIPDAAWAAHFARVDGRVHVATKPAKKLFATQPFKTDELVLVPLTTAVRFVNANFKVVKSTVAVLWPSLKTNVEGNTFVAVLYNRTAYQWGRMRTCHYGTCAPRPTSPMQMSLAAPSNKTSAV